MNASEAWSGCQTRQKSSMWLSGAAIRSSSKNGNVIL